MLSLPLLDKRKHSFAKNILPFDKRDFYYRGGSKWNGTYGTAATK
jgi:hypothetical protein